MNYHFKLYPIVNHFIISFHFNVYITYVLMKYSAVFSIHLFGYCQFFIFGFGFINFLKIIVF